MRRTRFASAVRASVVASTLVLSAAGAAQAQTTSHVVVLHANPALFDANGWSARAELARSFYASHADAYDFLVLFPAFPIDLLLRDVGEVMGKHWDVRNDISGIGLPAFDGGAQFGSARRLKGVIDVHSLVPGIDAPGADAALAVVAHETAHQWSARGVRVRDPRTGNPSAALLGRDGAHWSYFLDSDASVLYGSDWRDAGGGRFIADASQRRYSALDLYLMGFLEAAEVPGFSLLVPGPDAPSDATALPPPDGTSIAATAVPLSIADVIAAEGTRVPGVAGSQKAFRAAFVVVAPDGGEPSPDQLALVDEIRREWANRFFFMTRGRSVMETELVERAPAQAASSPTIAAGLEYLLSRQQPDGSWSDSSGLEVRDSQLAIEALAGFQASRRMGAAVANGASYLAGRPIQDADTCARVRLGTSSASALAGVSAPACFSNSWLDDRGGVGLSSGYRGTVLDTVLTGLSAARTDPAFLVGLDVWLLRNQNPDGGWSYLPGGPSEVEPTALVLRLLAGVSDFTGPEHAANAAEVFLATRRFPDGGYGDVESDPGLTAEVVLALGAWRVPDALTAQEFTAYLLAAQQADGSWGASVADTALAVRALREYLSPNVAITAVAAASSSATDGEVALATASIENAGRLPVATVEVQAFDGDGRPFGAPVTVSQLGAGERRQISLVLDTSGHGGSTELVVVVDPAGVVEESSKADNRLGRPFVVAGPSGGTDAVVVPGSVAAAPARLETLPSEVVLTATVGNVGLADAAHVLVEARVRGVAAGAVRVDLPARSRVPVAIPVSIGPGAGDVLVEIVVDPLGELADPRRSNNSAALVIPLVPTIDLRVAGLTLAPSEVEQGAELRVAYVLANAGTSLAQVPVEVRVADGAGRVVWVQRDPAVTVPGGASLLRTAAWRATVAGPVTVTVDAPHPADRNDVDNRASAATVVRASPHPNLVVRAVDLVASPNPALEGKPVSISATARNVGGAAAGAFALDFWLGAPGSGTRLGRETSAGLAAGAEWTGTMSVPVSATADLVVTVVADPDGAVAEVDETDNESTLTIPVRSRPNLVLGSGALVLSTSLPRPGEGVDVDVRVQNTGAQASEPTTVELRWRPADGAEQVVASAPLPSVSGSGSRSVTFRWGAPIAGTGTLAAIVNPACAASEATCEDNRAERSVLVQSGAVALTNPYFSPNGDGVKDDTEVFWRGDSGADVAVEVAPEKGGAPVRRLAGRAGSLVWDGKDAAGRIVRDGTYVVVVTSGAGALLGRATAVVDTNRTLLHEAPRSMMETELVNALVDEARGGPFDARILPDDSGIVLNGCGPQLPGGILNCGLYLQRFDGSPPRYLNAHPRRFAVSPDGASLAYVADDCSPTTGQTPDCVSLHLVSIPGGEDTRVWEAPTYPGWIDGFYSPAFSPDGRRVAFILGGNPEVGTVTVESVGVDGSDHRVIADPSDVARLPLGNHWWFNPTELAYSPDGVWVAVSDMEMDLLLFRDGPRETVLLFDGSNENWGSVTEPDGGDRQLWFANGREIAYAVTEGILGFDVATHAVRTIVSPRSLDVVDPMFLEDGKLARDPYSEALIFPAAAPGMSRWNSRFRVMLSSPIGAAPKPLWQAPEAGSTIDHLQWSASGATVEVGQWAYAQGTGWKFNRHVIRSLANLATRLVAAQSPGSRSMTFRGTATDANFERFEIQAKLLGEGAGAQTVVTSSVPVVNGELASWTPPSPGVYEATLLAFDKAGNARARRVRFAWGDASPIANLRRSPEFISPNGDGIQEEAVISYTVVAPVTVTATVATDAGGIVRTIQRTHSAPEDGAIAWDGLDDGGALVGDGQYWVEVAGSRFRVVVDTKRPNIQFALLDALTPGAGEEFTVRKVEEKARSSPCVVIDQDYKYDILQVFANATLQVTDDNLLDWRLEGTWDAPSTYHAGAGQGVEGFELPTTEVRGRTFQVLARDLAGNPAESAVKSYDEKVFLLGAGDELLTDWCAPQHGFLFMGYPTTWEVYPGLFEAMSPFVGGRTRWRTAPGARSMLVFTHTIREPIVSLAVMSRRSGNANEPYEFDYDVEDFHGVAALWNERDRTGTWEYVLAATDASGRVHYSEPVSLQRAEPQTDSCLAGDDRSDLRFGVKNPRDARTVATNDGRFEVFHAATSGVIEVRRDATELTWIAGEIISFDVSALRGCAYELRFTGHFTNGDPLEAKSSIDLCGTFVRDVRVSGATAHVTLGETYRAPLAEVAVYTADAASGGGSVERRVAPFEGQSPVFTLDLARQPMCSARSPNLVSRLADGSVIDETNRPDFRQCDSPPLIQVPCTRVSVGHWVRHDSATVCGGEASTMDVHISGNTTRSFASMDAKLVSLTGVPVATLATSGFVAGGKRFEAVAAIPVETLTSGSYLVSVEGRDDAGFTASAATPLDGAIVVERVNPIVSVVAPRSGATVCPTRVEERDGSVRWLVDVVGTATDEHLEYASVAVKRPGASGYARRSVTVANGGQMVSGILDRVEVEPGLPGEWGIRIAGRDATGNEACTPETLFHVPGVLHLSHLTAAPELFSPDRDGVLDETALSFDLDEAADVRIVAHLPDGVDAEVAHREAVAGNSSVTWDGTTAPQDALPQGRVPLEVVARPACGAPARAFVTVEVDTLSPVVTVTSPAPGARASAEFAVTGSISDAHLQRWTVSLARPGSAAFEAVAEGSGAPGDILATIPAHDLATGSYVLRVEAFDAVGHATHLDVPFDVVPGAILDRFVVSPPLVSPNGDKRFDTAVATFALKQAAAVTLEVLDPTGAVAATALSASPRSAGVVSVPLDAALAVLAKDGDYAVRVSAEAGGATESAVAPLGVDRVAPIVTIATPAGQACLAGALAVQGRVDDAHLRAWTVSVRTPGSPDALVASGVRPVDGTIAVAAPPAEGAHLLVVHADDLVGNPFDQVIPFVSDRTPPDLVLLSPADGAWVSGLKGAIDLMADVADANLVEWTLAVRDTAGNEQALGSGPATGLATASWDARLAPEEATTLVAHARDCAGNVTRREARVTVDHTLPTAMLTAPRDSYVRAGPLAFTGTADDVNLERWTLELAQGPAFAAVGWVAIASGTERVLAAPLGELLTLPADGLYATRLTVRDRAGNERVDVATFVVDTTPPGPPVLSGHVRRPSDAVLTWTASPAPDVVAYRVLRARGTSALAVTTQQSAPSHAWEDPGLQDGSWSYAVVAVDAAGLESVPSNVVTLPVDATPPRVAIAAPRAGATVSGVLDVVGTAFSIDDFKEYRLSVGSGAAPASFALLRRSPSPVQNDVLASLETAGLPQGSIQTLRLEAEDLSGNLAEARVTFAIDNQAPATPVLVSATALSRDVTLTWEPMSAPDLAGFVVYRDGLPVGIPAGALSDPRAYLIAPGLTSFVDAGVPDGTFTYRIQAFDVAANPSPLSNALSVTVDLRAPEAIIVNPARLARIPGPLEVTAESDDRDLASVQFEVRAGGQGAFVPLGAPVTHAPWATVCDPRAFPSPVVEFRAVATDAGGQSDPAPEAVVAFFDPPLTDPQLAASALGYDVALRWTDPNAPERVAGYVVRADGATVLAAAPRPGGSASASATGASAAYDDDVNTRWVGAYGPQWWQLELASRTVVDGITVANRYLPSTFDVSVRVKGAWVKLARGLQAPMYGGAAPVPVAPPLEIEVVRVEFAAGSYPPDLAEVTVSPVALTTTTSFVHAGAALGPHRYEVAATSPFGSTSSAKTSATVYRPTLETPPPASSTTPVAIQGYGVPEGADVALSGADGSVVARTTATKDGTFQFLAPLVPGANTFTAEAVDPHGHRSAPSDAVTISLDAPPATAVTLALEGISGSDVSLTFAATDVTSDVAGFALSRDSGDGSRVIATVPAAARAVIDRGVRNGTHLYRIAAVNGRGFAATPSNTVTAVVAVPALPPPVLAVTVPAEGRELQLAWTTASPTASTFVVERETVAGSSTFMQIATGVATTAYLDTGLTNGVEYRYRVTGIDRVGNAGPPSNVASGVPRDGRAPPAPRITEPTTPGAPIAVADQASTVAGIAEFGATVELSQNGRFGGSTRATRLAVEASPFTLAYAPTSRVDAPSGAGRIAYQFTGPAGDQRIAVQDLSTEQVLEQAIPAGLAVSNGPYLAPSGDRVAIVASDPAAGYRTNVWIGDLAGPLHLAEVEPVLGARGAAWSPDGSRLAYVEASGSLVVADGDGGKFRACPGRALTGVGWISSTEVGGVEHDTKTSLVGCGVSNTSTRTIVSAEDIAGWVAQSGAVAAMVVDASYRHWLDVVDRGGRTHRLGEASNGTPSLSPDGARVAWLVNGTLYVGDVATGEAHGAGYQRWGRIVAWPSPSTLVGFPEWGGADADRLDVRGRFEVPVTLENGDNLFTAIAIDDAGNRSPSSDPILVRLEPGQLADLAVEAQVQPPVAAATRPANAIVTIRNLGPVASSPADLEASFVVSTGESRTAAARVPSIAPGGQVTAALTLDTALLAGTYRLHVTVDPRAVLADRDRSNNAADVSFHVAPSTDVAMELAALPASVPCGGVTTARVTIVNPGGARDASLEVSLGDADGVRVATVPAPGVALRGGAATVVEVPVSVGLALAGAYRIQAVLSAGGAVLASASAPVTVEPEALVALELTSARATYAPDERIDLVAAVANRSRNSALSSATIRFDLVNAAGATIPVASRPVPFVWVGGEVAIGASIPAGSLPAGHYLAHAVLEDGGAPLGQATTAFSVSAAPLLAGALAVSGAGTVPATKAGLPLTVAAAVRNVGTGIALAAVADLVTVAADGTELGRIALDLGDVAVAASSSQVVTLPTTGLPLGTYGLVLVARYDGRTETLATARFRVADGLPPALVVEAPADRAFVRGAVAPRVRASDDASGVASVDATVAGTTVQLALASGFALDGVWSGTIPLPVDGPYAIVLSARDAEGNDGLVTASAANPLVLYVTSDTVPPSVRVDGVVPDSLVNVVVTPVVVATDLNLWSVDSYLDGAAFSGGGVADDGDHVFTAVAADKAGNSGGATVRFTIDRTPPQISLLGVGDAACSAAAVAPRIDVFDTHLDASSATLDGVPFQTGTVLGAERSYRIAVAARDRAGNLASLDRTVTVDLTAPVIDVTGVVDGAFVNRSPAPVITIADANLVSSEVMLDGAPHVSGTPITGEGTHLLNVTAMDCAGHLASLAVSFVIDTAAPSITVAGVAEGEIVNRDVVPMVTVSDRNLASWRTTIDGVELPLGGAVSSEAPHVLDVVATDLAGNVATSSRRFEIDRTAPEVWASVTDGATYGEARTVSFGATDRNLISVAATLDGAPFSAGGLVEADGPHTLVVSARDAAGNETIKTLGFRLLAVKYAVKKHVVDRSARVLAMVPCEGRRGDRIEKFLAAAIPDAPLTVVRTRSDLLFELRTGRHSVVVLAGREDEGEDEDGDWDGDGCRSTRPKPQLDGHALESRLVRELTEAVFRGTGLVVFGDEDDEGWPHLGEALGLEYDGDDHRGTVDLRESAVSGAMTLTIPEGVDLKLLGASDIGSYHMHREGSSGCGGSGHHGDEHTAAAVHAFGEGAAVSFGFDPSLARSASDAARLLAGAVAYVAPAAELVARGVVEVGIDVTNESRATTTRVREALDPALQVVDVLSGGERTTTGGIEWQFDQPGGTTRRLAYLVRLPAAAGSYPTSSEVASLSVAGASVAGAFPLDLVVERDAGEILSSAETLATAIAARGADGHARKAILAALAAVRANPAATAADREDAIERLLAAVHAVRELRTVDPAPLRLELDLLIGMWEARP